MVVTTSPPSQDAQLQGPAFFVSGAAAGPAPGSIAGLGLLGIHKRFDLTSGRWPLTPIQSMGAARKPRSP